VLQGYLVHKKTLPPRTLQQDYAEGPVVVLGGGVVSYERGSPVHLVLTLAPMRARAAPASSL